MATIKSDTVTREKTVTEKVPVYVLTLTIEEAQALHSVLRHVGGPKDGGRKHTDAVLKSLEAVGARNTKYTLSPNYGGLYFGNGSSPFDTLTPNNNAYSAVKW